MRLLLRLCLVTLLLALVSPLRAAQFTEVGATMGLPTAIGGAWGDYDNDGYPDLFTGGVWESHRCALWHNNGDGTFSDVAVARGLQTDASTWEDWGAAWGDYNNDGQLDLVVTGGNHNVFLYRNDGDHFTEVGAAAGFVYYATARGAAWGDYDADGWLDLYVCYEESDVSRLFHNNQDGTFTEVTNPAGMELWPAGLGSSAAWADYNSDGWLDLLVTRQSPSTSGHAPRLYRNLGDGSFADAESAAGLLDVDNAQGLSWGDYDNDGKLDLYLSAERARPHWLYHNNGDGTFTQTTSSAGMTDAASAYGTAWADYDNDGWLDLVVANSGTTPTLYHNAGNSTFTEVSSTEGMTAVRKYRTAIWADYDLDGKPDLYAGVYDSASALFHNTGTAGTWLRVRTLTNAAGDATNGDPVRDAIGAKVQLNLDNDLSFPTGRTLQRTIDGGSSFCGQDEQVAQFGLGTATEVAVRVTFPDQSVVTRWGVDANQTIGVLDVVGNSTDARFWDVPPDFWAFDSVEAAADAGIVQGYWDGSYRPANTVTRAQMAVYIARALAGGDAYVPTGVTTVTFTDVPADYWAFKYVEYLATSERVVVQGYWDGYHPEETVTRGQMAVYIARAIVTPTGDANIPTPAGDPTFPDVPADYWAYRYIEYLADQGIVSGYWDGYRPEDPVTRDQMAVYVSRAFDLIP